MGNADRRAGRRHGAEPVRPALTTTGRPRTTATSCAPSSSGRRRRRPLLPLARRHGRAVRHGVTPRRPPARRPARLEHPHGSLMPYALAVRRQLGTPRRQRGSASAMPYEDRPGAYWPLVATASPSSGAPPTSSTLPPSGPADGWPTPRRRWPRTCSRSDCTRPTSRVLEAADARRRAVARRLRSRGGRGRAPR